MAKWLPCLTAPSAEVVRPIDTSIMGGLAERWVADSARKPAGPSTPLADTMATPIARHPIAFQKVFASISLSMPVLLCCPGTLCENSAGWPCADVARAGAREAARPGEDTTKEPALYFCVECSRLFCGILGWARCDSEYQRTKKNRPCGACADARRSPAFFARLVPRSRGRWRSICEQRLDRPAAGSGDTGRGDPRQWPGPRAWRRYRPGHRRPALHRVARSTRSS